MTEPLHFDCPYCSASIEVTFELTSGQGEKVKCSGCQRKLAVPDSLLSKLPEPDDDDDFLAGVPMMASGDDDVLTAADLAIESEQANETPDVAATSNLLENDFEFSIAEGASSDEGQSEEGDHEKEHQSASSNGSEDSDDPEVDKPLDGAGNRSKTEGDEDLNKLLAGIVEVTLPPVEKGSFGIRCSVCDSKLLVNLGQVGEEVKCSDCFSMIKVRSPTAKEKEQIEKQIRLSLEEGSSSSDSSLADDGELTLAPLEEDELGDVELVAEIVEDVDEPLNFREEHSASADELSGGGMQDDDFADVLLDDDDEDVSQDHKEDDFPDEVVDEIGEDLLSGDLSLSGPLELEDASFVDPAMLAAAGKKAKDKGKKKREQLNPYRSKSAQQAEKRQKVKGYKPKQKNSDKAKSKFPELRFDTLFGAAVELVTEPSVAVRGFTVAALLAVGNVISHSALATYSAIEEPTMGDTATMGFWRLGVGWLPYAIGTILLWYFCGVVFREATDGKKKIESWKLGHTTEWSSTLLITAVSFAIAGSPVLMFMSIYVTAPVRFLLALPFLTAVWYSQSPFAIISSDVVMHFRSNGKQWKTVFLVVLALASIAFVAGVLMHVPVPWLSILTSALGAVFLSFVTMAFAAVAGWHSGMVVEELN